MDPKDHPTHTTPRYRLYIDESGDHTYRLLDNPAHRYLGLLGVWFRQVDNYQTFVDALDRLKRDVFGPRPDKPVILHPYHYCLAAMLDRFSGWLTTETPWVT